ncbi:DUF3325 domain-containing protein [Pseudomonas putida]|nr:DUF3325 domain-containing protein [Pseudomonas putida]EKT4514505.1 DUF3325 domain-containing protein [Pseudomonas putida]
MLGNALIAFAGFVALCLAMEKHFSDLHLLRVAGWLLLMLSLVFSVHQRGWALGLVEWTAVMMAGVTLWVFGLPYQPRLLLGLAAVSVVLGPMLAVLAV